MTRLTVFCLLLLAAAIPAHLSAAPEAPEPISAELEALKVTVDAEGKEHLAPAEEVRPGDLLEYRASYRNGGDADVAGIAPVLPVPAGLEFVAQEGPLAAAQASRDGKVFAPIPLTYEVTLPDGSTEIREVPLAEYRFLKWDPASLAPGEHFLVSARMRVGGNSR